MDLPKKTKLDISSLVPLPRSSPGGNEEDLRKIAEDFAKLVAPMGKAERTRALNDFLKHVTEESGIGKPILYGAEKLEKTAAKKMKMAL